MSASLVMTFLPHEAPSGVPGELHVSVRGVPIWRHAEDPTRGVVWDWIGLLRMLTAHWPWLEHEQAFPIAAAVGPGHPGKWQRWFDERQMQVADEVADLEADTWASFTERHDLAQGVPGIVLPALWCMREGMGWWIAWGDADDEAAFLTRAESLEPLRACADALAAIAARSTTASDRAVAAAWAAAESRATTLRLAIAANRPDIEAIRSALSAPIREQFDRDERWGIAARGLPTGLAPDIVARCYALAAAVPEMAAPAWEALDRLSTTARQQLVQLQHLPPHSQGYHLAAWLRQEIGQASSPIAVRQYLTASLGIPIRQLPEDLADLIDGLAIWNGRRLGIYVSGLMSRARTHATLAHELSHVLVDRGDTRPLWDVRGGALDGQTVAEKRAGAFAAEFLFPHEALIDASRLRQIPQQLREVARLAGLYGVSQWLALNHAEHFGLGPFPRDDDYALGELTPSDR